MIFGLKPRRVAKGDPNAISFGKIDIPAASKPTLRDELKMLGINRSALFPEIDHAARDIVERYSN